MALNDKAAKRVLDALHDLDEVLADEVADRLQSHDAESRPLLVVFGEHNSGKTALVARLLIDAGETVPRGALRRRKLGDRGHHGQRG